MFHPRHRFLMITPSEREHQVGKALFSRASDDSERHNMSHSSVSHAFCQMHFTVAELAHSMARIRKRPATFLEHACLTATVWIKGGALAYPRLSLYCNCCTLRNPANSPRKAVNGLVGNSIFRA